MAAGSNVDVELVASDVPVFPGVADLVAAGFVPGGTRRNLAWAGERLDAAGVDEATLIVLADAQTSGGLLFGADPDAADAAVVALVASGHAAAVVGTVAAGTGTIRVRS
jgi:selenide,water dikinase